VTQPPELLHQLALLPALNCLTGPIVPGDGPRDPQAVFVGEGPGSTEVQTLIPFTGRAGQRLNTFLEEAGLSRDSCWMTNVLKRRAVGDDGRDRPPSAEESAASLLYLWRELDLWASHSTRVVCALGRTAACALGGERLNDLPMHLMHGNWKVITDPYAGTVWMLFITFHPSAALRDPAIGKLLAADVAKFTDEVTRHGAEVLEKLGGRRV
jgi:uracil-DNA glycosylase